MSDCCLIKKVATVEVYENKNEVRAYGFMAGDRNTPVMEVKFKHLWGEENLSKCKLRWIIVDDLGSLLVGEVPIEQDNTASIQLPNELFTGERRMKVQLTVASCDGSRILNLQQFTDLKVINNLASNEVVEPVYQMLINQVYDDTKKYLAELETSYKAKYGSLESVYAKSKASLEQYLINAENGGNAEFLQGYNPKNFNRVENTINELINSAGSKYKVGDVVEVLGYYTAGDGAHHKRKIESADDGSGIQLASGLWANIVHNGEVNVSWFGAKGESVDFDNTAIVNKALDFCNVCNFSAGTFYFDGSIILKNNYVVKGVSRDLVKLCYKGDSDFIVSEDSSTCRNIKIDNLTVLCYNNRQIGTGIKFLRTTKSGDTWHKISNVQVMYFEYGMKLLNNLNEMQIERVNCRYNKTGCYVLRTYDMFFTDCVFSVNKRHGLELSNCGEIRFTSCKSWYNGAEDDAKYCNLFLTSAKGIAFTGLGLQESYGTNCRIEYSECIMIQGFFSQPALTSETAKQISLRTTNNCNIDITTENYKRENEYKHSLLHIESLCRNNTINIKYIEKDFPEEKKFIFTTQHSSSAFVGNTINITTTQNVHERKIKNYAKNGDLSNKSTTSFLYYPSSNIYFENEKLVVNSSASATNLNFNTTKIDYPNSKHTMYCVFKKVSGSGRVVANYNGWVDVAESDDVGTMYQVAYWLTPASETPLTNLRVAFPSGLVVEVVEIGFVPSMYCHSGYPLIESAKIPVVSYSSLDTPYYTLKMQQENVYEDFVSYMDAKLEYDKEQRYLEEQRQLAFESREDQEQTYEEWLATQPVLIPDTEPQPSQKLLEFKNKYIV